KNGNYTQAKIFKQFKESKAPVTEVPKPNPIPTEPPAPAPQVLELLDISSVPDASVRKLFELYKQTKAVSPGWGGAAIYKNLQETKKLLTGEAWSNLNDGQLLKMLDKAYGKPGKTYCDETVSWLKTTN